MAKTVTEKRKVLRAILQEPGCHLAPSCNDGIQARLVEWLGFPLVHISGSGRHRALGFADAGLLTVIEMIDKARQIVEAVNLPIVSDAETGYDNAVNVVRTVREFERADVAAIHMPGVRACNSLRCGWRTGRTLSAAPLLKLLMRSAAPSNI